MTALTFNRLIDYDYSTRHCVYEVVRGDSVLGIVENWEGEMEWKAYLGSGFSCKYLAKYYSRCAAVRAIIKMTAEL